MFSVKHYLTVVLKIVKPTVFVSSHQFFNSGQVFKGGVPLETFTGGGGFAVTVFNRMGIFLAHNPIFAHIFQIYHRRYDPTSF